MWVYMLGNVNTLSLCVFYAVPSTLDYGPYFAFENVNGTIIISEGAPIGELFVIVRGLCRVVLSPWQPSRIQATINSTL